MADETPEKPHGSEYRSSDRAAITLRVDYKRLNTFFADYTRNISKGGTFIRTVKPLDVGTEFVFVLTFPHAETASDPRAIDNAASDTAPGPHDGAPPQTDRLELRGEVVWIVSEAKASEEQPAGMGIRFLFDDDEARLKIDSFVEGLMKETLGEHLSERLLKKGR